jgi:fatty-acyl-CoA synthase
VIISGGENIASVEVEQAIADYPAVLEVAVVAVPDPKYVVFGSLPKTSTGKVQKFVLREQARVATAQPRIVDGDTEQH